MFQHTSRYYHISDASFCDKDGEVSTYKKRRFLPQIDTITVNSLVTVKPKERLDFIAAQTLGDPLQFWRIADANDVMDPFSLTQNVGQTIVIPGINFGL